MLWRKAYRDLRAMGLRAVLIVVVIGAGPGTAAGIALAMHDVEATRDDFYSRYALADLDLRLRAPLPAAQLRRRAKEAGARRTEVRLILDGAALHGGSRTAAEVVGMPVGTRLNRLAVTAGDGLDRGAPRGAAVDTDYADRAGIGLGDRVRLRLAGRTISVRVRGLARSPEYLLATANPDYLVPQRGSLAVVFLPRASLRRLTGLRGANDLAVDLPGGGNGKAAERLAAGLPTARVTPRSRQYGRRLTEADIHSFTIFAPVMGVVFGIVGLLLIALSLRRLVSSQRRELGALLAIGYPARTVVGSVMLLAAALAILGAALAIGATIGVGRLVANEYASAVGFPATRYPLAFGPLALAAGLALVATLLAALLPAYRLARLDPIEALRGESVGSFELPGWLQRLTAVGPPALTYGLRGLLRRPLLSAATVLSIAGAVGLGAALNILVSSTDSSVDASFAGQGWTHSADLARPLPDRRVTALAKRSGANRAEPTVKGPAELRTSAAAGGVGAQLTGLPRRPALLRLDLTAGGDPGPRRIVLSEQTADRLGVGPGDPIALRTSAGRTTVRVGGVARTLATEQAYLPRAEAARLLGLAGRATSVLVAGDAADARRLRADPAVARVTSKASALAAERELLDELTGLISVLQAISLGVGALFLVSTLALSYLDRRGEFATLAALGYGRRQIGAAVAGEALTQTLLAAALSIPLGILIASPLSRRISEAWFEIGLHPQAPSFLLVILPALALALLAAAHATRRALRLNIAATVRARLIG